MNWNKFLNAKRLRPSERDPDPRNDFESDFGRIIFSPAIRRMHDKTQVFPLTTDDNIHSRLTHSLEVMALGHSLGLGLVDNEEFVLKTELDKASLLRQIPVILKNACLVHDIGNPPFGHFGETSIQNFFKDFFKDKDEENLKIQRLLKSNKLDNDEKEELKSKIFKLDYDNKTNDKLLKEDFLHFDGNAQGFRVLTKLQVLDDPYGLNLTYGTLSSSLKYPNTGKLVKTKKNLKKRGVFQSEKKYLNQIAKDCGLKKQSEIIRHPLSFIMEAADTICYRVMDIEDGYNMGWYSYEDIKGYLISVNGLKEIFQKIENNEKIKSEVSRVVNLRIQLIRFLVDATKETFLNNYDLICQGKYNYELVEAGRGKELEEKLKNFCGEYIFPKRNIQFLELTGESVLNGLLTYYTKYIFHENKNYRKRAKNLISKSTIRASRIENNDVSFEDLDNYYKLRVIVDFISGMTDQYAINHYQKLSGQKII